MIFSTATTFRRIQFTIKLTQQLFYHMTSNLKLNTENQHHKKKTIVMIMYIYKI